MIADLPSWGSKDEVITIANGDKLNLVLVEAFWKRWADKVEDCDGRIKALRSFLERQFELLDKMVYISWEMSEHSKKTE
jgi:hypothetical protein